MKLQMQHSFSVSVPHSTSMTKVRGEPCTQTAGFQYCTISHPPPPPPTAGLVEWMQPAIVSISNHNCPCNLMGTGTDLTYKRCLNIFHSQTAHQLHSLTVNNVFKAKDKMHTFYFHSKMPVPH